MTPNTPCISVTGVGLVAPSGATASQLWEKVEQGVTLSQVLQAQQHGEWGIRPAASVEPFALALKHPKNERYMGAALRCGAKAASEAITQAGFDATAIDQERIALHLGTGQTGLEPTELFQALGVASTSDTDDMWAAVGGKAARLIDPFFGLRTLSNAGTGLLSLECNARGPSSNFVQGEVAASHAIAAGIRDLREHKCDAALVGGYDSLLSLSTLLTFEDAGLTSTTELGFCYRPFDRCRDGCILGEGAGFLLLEREDDARARGAQPLFHLVDVGTSNDAMDLDHADDDSYGSSLGRAVSQCHALDRERLAFIVGRGLGSIQADAVEARVINKTFGDRVPITAFKGCTGYLGAATGAVECCLAGLALKDRVAPPIAGLSQPDATGLLDFVTREARPIPESCNQALCVTSSLSGQLAVLLLEAA